MGCLARSGCAGDCVAPTPETAGKVGLREMTGTSQWVTGFRANPGRLGAYVSEKSRRAVSLSGTAEGQWEGTVSQPTVWTPDIITVFCSYIVDNNNKIVNCKTRGLDQCLVTTWWSSAVLQC